MTGGGTWSRVEQCLDELLELPPRERWAASLKLTTGDSRLRDEVEALLMRVDLANTRLDRPASSLIAEFTAGAPILQAGDVVDAYRIIALIGQGGMGEVYRAERADGLFEQPVALKVIRREVIDHISRFQLERQILAQFDHPFITRIYDGGLLAGKRPYMVMELVSGQPITDWCTQRASNLDERIKLFLDVCDAVAYAHKYVIIHRDLKPANLLVTESGQVKLLDFGIAKKMSGLESTVTLNAPLTPSYAAPEQLTGQPVSTATDVYGLGAILFELLTDEKPFTLSDSSLATSIDQVINLPSPRPSDVARANGTRFIASQSLKGDLDAIVAKTLRKEPKHRYQTVNELMEDVLRWRSSQPVLARSGTRLYVFGRFVRRQRLLIVAAAVVSAAVLLGLCGVAWQYVRAERQAERADIIKSFLVSLFSDTDPNFPVNKPREAVTAEELINLGVPRISREYSHDPIVETELLGAAAEIYRGLANYDRAQQIQLKQIALSQSVYGSNDPILLRDMIERTWSLISLQRWDEVKKSLDESDRVLTKGRLRASGLEAEWWNQKAQWLEVQPQGTLDEGLALQKSDDLYKRYDPSSVGRSQVLNQLGLLRFYSGDYRAAIPLYQQAISIMQNQPHPENLELAGGEANLAQSQELLGDLDSAEASYAAAEKEALPAGFEHAEYWFAVSQHALMINRYGDWRTSLTMLSSLLEKASPTAPDESVQAQVKLIYATCLNAVGRGSAAIPILESTLVTLKKRPTQGNDVERALLTLGRAYSIAGRFAEARETFVAAGLGSDNPQRLGQRGLYWREAWGEVLLALGLIEQADRVFKDVIEHQPALTRGQGATTAAAALCGRARAALARHDLNAAASLNKEALLSFASLQPPLNVRAKSPLLETQSVIELAQGNLGAAVASAREALELRTRTDAPESLARVAAAQALQSALQMQASKRN